MSGFLHLNIFNVSTIQWMLQILAINIFLLKPYYFLWTFSSCKLKACLIFHITIFRMRYVAAYLLAALSGNNSPSADDLKKIIGSVGIDCEADKITKIIGELKGKNLEELITKG